MTAIPAWERLDAFLAEHLPALRDDLAPGASAADLEALARAARHALPDDLRALYRRHDGQRGHAGGLFFGLRFVPAREAAEERARWTSLLDDDPALVHDIEVSAHPEGAVRAVYADPAWLPFASDGSGNHLAVDLDPGPLGTRGQVISFGADEPVRYVLAPSVGAFLAWCLEQLETGRGTAEPESGALRLAGSAHLLDALPGLFGRP